MKEALGMIAVIFLFIGVYVFFAGGIKITYTLNGQQQTFSFTVDDVTVARPLPNSQVNKKAVDTPQ